MQFYARFQDEVVADHQVIAVHVERARYISRRRFSTIFDEALVSSHAQLVAEPWIRRGKG